MTDEEQKAAEEAAAKKKAEEDAGKVGIDKVIQAIQYLGQKQRQTDELFAKIDTSIAGLVEQVKNPVKEPDKPVVKDAVDLEGMSNAQLTEHITESVVKAINEQSIKPMQERFGVAEDKMERKFIQGDIDTAAENYSDFWQWKDEISKIVEEKPNLSIDEAYAIARSKSPDKLEELDKKAAEAKVEQDKKDAKKTDEEFGGLLPTSGLSSRNEGMDTKEAAEAAFEELIAGTPHEKMLSQ